MSQTYQLSKIGIERLERFKRDVLAGAIEINPEYYESGEICYYTARNKETLTCCFTSDRDKVIADLHEQIEVTFNGVIEKRYMSYDSAPYFCVVNGIVIKRVDITTPAQRALEAVASKLN
tara:strand:+ start:18 stop:377 length:360 start_codon:yes stop_codon:yes gene_type:complete